MEQAFIIDRIEGETVVVEDSNENMVNIEIKYIIGEPSEGDVIIRVNNNYTIDKEATERRKKEIEKLMKGMWSE